VRAWKMADINLKDCSAFNFSAREMRSWSYFVDEFGHNEEIHTAYDVVYIIRSCRPYAVRYKSGWSSTIYIGQGNFRNRITSHLNNWVHPLSIEYHDIGIEIRMYIPRVRNNYYAFKQVEGYLICEFEKKYGELPSGNDRKGSVSDRHKYNFDFGSILGLGRGPGYEWDIDSNWLRDFIRRRKR